MNKVFVINRSEWLRGEGEAGSCLLRPEDGKMCCLGQFAIHLGIPKETILNVAAPNQMYHRFWPDWLVLAPTAKTGHFPNRTCTCDYLMETNDSIDMTDEEREDIIKEQFGDQGIKVKFVD